jgi:hypothetical protein
MKATIQQKTASALGRIHTSPCGFIAPLRRGFSIGGIMEKYRRPTIFIKGRGQILLSRFTMENHLGRRLSIHELVHHKDENPFNNQIENLVLCTRSEHKHIHAKIGIKTRLKKKYNFNPLEITALYSKLQRCDLIAKELGCHVITIERALREILHVNKLRDFRKQKGWKYGK